MAQEAAAKCLAELREDDLGTKRAQAIARDLGAFAAIGQELARGGACSLEWSMKECNPMLREIGLFGAGVPSPLLLFPCRGPAVPRGRSTGRRLACTASSGIRHWCGWPSSSACFPVSSY